MIAVVVAGSQRSNEQKKWRLVIHMYTPPGEELLLGWEEEGRRSHTPHLLIQSGTKGTPTPGVDNCK